MGLIPILGVWAGLSLGGGVVTGGALQPYIQDALNEIEVRKYGALLYYPAKTINYNLSILSGTQPRPMVRSEPAMAALHRLILNISRSETKTSSQAAWPATLQDSPPSTTLSRPNIQVSS